MKTYKIGDVARLLGATTQALRFYEQEGVIVPQKTENGTRIYTENLVDNKRPAFVFSQMAVPAELVAGKKNVEVRFVPKSGNTAGGIFGLWMTR